MNKKRSGGDQHEWDILRGHDPPDSEWDWQAVTTPTVPANVTDSALSEPLLSGGGTPSGGEMNRWDGKNA